MQTREEKLGSSEPDTSSTVVAEVAIRDAREDRESQMTAAAADGGLLSESKVCSERSDPAGSSTDHRAGQTWG